MTKIMRGLPGSVEYVSIHTQNTHSIKLENILIHLHNKKHNIAVVYSAQINQHNLVSLKQTHQNTTNSTIITEVQLFIRVIWIWKHWEPITTSRGWLHQGNRN